MAYHPETDGQPVNQVFQNMLRMYAMDQRQKWKDYPHLVEFAHNNSDHSSLGHLLKPCMGENVELPLAEITWKIGFLLDPEIDGKPASKLYNIEREGVP